MTKDNLAMVFAPSFLRCPSEDPSQIMAAAEKEKAVRTYPFKKKKKQFCCESNFYRRGLFFFSSRKIDVIFFLVEKIDPFKLCFIFFFLQKNNFFHSLFWNCSTSWNQFKSQQKLNCQKWWCLKERRNIFLITMTISLLTKVSLIYFYFLVLWTNRFGFCHVNDSFWLFVLGFGFIFIGLLLILLVLFVLRLLFWLYYWFLLVIFAHFCSFLVKFINLNWTGQVLYWGRDEKKEPIIITVNTNGTGRDKYRTVLMSQKVCWKKKTAPEKFNFLIQNYWINE